MKQILVMMAAVVLVGCSKDTLELPQAAEAEAQVTPAPTSESDLVSPVDKKLIADPIVEQAVRDSLEKPVGEITEADLEKVTILMLNGDLLYSTEITDEGLVDLAKLQNLEKLGLAHTQITDTGLKAVAKLQNLTFLALSFTKITDEGLKEVAKLQKLSVLLLGNTKITDAGLKEVAKLQKLEMLWLRDTKITDEGLKDVAKLQKLTFLDLSNTKITKADVAELKKAMPNCEIEGP